MATRIYSFSVKETDDKAKKLVEEVKLKSAKKGVNFSFVVLESLKLYKEKELAK